MPRLSASASGMSCIAVLNQSLKSEFLYKAWEKAEAKPESVVVKALKGLWVLSDNFWYNVAESVDIFHVAYQYARQGLSWNELELNFGDNAKVFLASPTNRFREIKKCLFHGSRYPKDDSRSSPY